MERQRAQSSESEAQGSRQQLAALRAENGALKQQKAQANQREKKAAEDKLAAAEVNMLSICSALGGSTTSFSKTYSVCGAENSRWVLVVYARHEPRQLRMRRRQ